jgi:hypothetical protein
LSDKFSANKLAFAKTEGFMLETSADGGATWIDETSTISSDKITTIFSGPVSSSIKLCPSNQSAANLNS